MPFYLDRLHKDRQRGELRGIGGSHDSHLLRDRVWLLFYLWQAVCGEFRMGSVGSSPLLSVLSRLPKLPREIN